MLLAGGFEGRHYIYDEATNTISNGPEAGDYTFDGWAWGIRHKDFRGLRPMTRESTLPTNI